MLRKLDVGDEVITTGGIVGVITFVEDDLFHLEVDTDVVIRIAKSAVARSTAEPDPADKPAVALPSWGEGRRRGRGRVADDEGTSAPRPDRVARGRLRARPGHRAHRQHTQARARPPGRHLGQPPAGEGRRGDRRGHRRAARPGDRDHPQAGRRPRRRRARGRPPGQHHHGAAARRQGPGRGARGGRQDRPARVPPGAVDRRHDARGQGPHRGRGQGRGAPHRPGGARGRDRAAGRHRRADPTGVDDHDHDGGACRGCCELQHHHDGAAGAEPVRGRHQRRTLLRALPARDPAQRRAHPGLGADARGGDHPRRRGRHHLHPGARRADRHGGRGRHRRPEQRRAVDGQPLVQGRRERHRQVQRGRRALLRR